MTKCIYCRSESLDPHGYRRNFCDSCVKDKDVGFPYLRQTRTLSTGMTISTAWEKETERRVMLPVERKDGGDHYVGRKEDSGRVSERTVDLRD